VSFPEKLYNASSDLITSIREDCMSIIERVVLAKMVLTVMVFIENIGGRKWRGGSIRIENDLHRLPNKQ